MSFTKISDIRQDMQVANILMAYTNTDYLADVIFPTVPNLKNSTGYIVQAGNEHLRTYSTKRATHDESAHRIEFSYSNDKRYSIDDYDASSYIADKIQREQEKPVDLLRDTAVRIIQALKNEREKAVAEIITTTSTYGSNTVTLSGTSQFNDYVNSSPEDVIEGAISAVHSATGRTPNSMIISREVLTTLKNHPYFTNAVHGIKTISNMVIIELIKDIFGLENVFVGKGISVNSKEGQTENKPSIWGKDIVLFYRPSAPSLFMPSFGYSFQLAGRNIAVNTRRAQEDKGDVVEVVMSYQDMIVDANAGYLIKSAIA